MSGRITTHLVRIARSSGIETNVYQVLDCKPSRQEQKIKTLRKYVRQYPQGWKKRLQLAQLLCSVGDWEQAVEEYSQVIERQPRTIGVRLQLGKVLHLLGRQAEAIEVYQRARVLAQNSATQHHVTGLIEICQGGSLQAAREFETAASLEPDNAAHWLALGQVCWDAENAVAALQAFDAVLKLKPDDVVALVHSYDALMAVDRVEEALKRLERAYELDPQDFRTVGRLADYRSRARRVWGEEGKQTKQLIRAVLQQAPHAAEPRASLAGYYLFRGDRAKGAKILQQFVREHPNDPHGWYGYARYLFHSGDYDAAAEAILKAHKLYSNHYEIYRALCEILPRAGRSDELSPRIQEMLDRFGSRWSVWFEAGRVWVESFEDLEKGCKLAAVGPQLMPDLTAAWFGSGRVLALAGRHREAIEALRQGWERLSPGAEGWQSLSAAAWLAESYRALGEDAIARQWWEETQRRSQACMNFHPTNALQRSGRALEELGDRTQAVEAYRKALSLQICYPARTEVEEALERLQADPDSLGV